MTFDPKVVSVFPDCYCNLHTIGNLCADYEQHLTHMIEGFTLRAVDRP